MKQVIFADLNDYKSIIEEEQYLFVYSILSQLDLPLEEILPDSYTEFDRDHKIALRSLLEKFSLNIVDNRDGEIKIYHEKDILAIWKKPLYKRKIDRSEIDRKKRIYIELTLETWSVFEEQNE